MTSVRTAAGRLLWYLKEVTGEHDYARYVEHQRHHPNSPVLSRRQFERLRMDELDKNPQQRCC